MLMLLGVILCPALAGALDFTPVQVPAPEPNWARPDPRLLFRDGERKCSYLLPRGWTFCGSKEKLSLEANDRSHAVASIEQIPLKAPAPFDEEVIKALQSEMLKGLPEGSQDIKVVRVESNALLIDDHETVEITVNYCFLGRDRMKSVLFVNLGASQLRFTLFTLTPEFENAHELFRRSYYSWQWL